MVSRYGVAKDGAIGVAVSIGPMHCFLPHCGAGGTGRPTHFSTHPPNNPPNHNHIHPHNHQPLILPQSLSPQQHLRQMNHVQQQPHQGQQSPQYRIITGNACSDFHVPGQSYGAQPGGQVGGGTSNLGVSGGRGPPTLSGIQSIGQTTPGIQTGGPGGAQQQASQTQNPGVQQQTPQGPPPTTTPPVHTSSPQEMGKQIHHPSQSASLQQPYVGNQSRVVPQGFYQMTTRSVPSRNSGHRNSQGSAAPNVVSMPGVAGGAGQPPMYSHHPNLNVPGTPMFVPSQVPSIHAGPHTAMYSVNSQMPQIAFQQHRHQTHQGQQFFASFPHTILPPNIYPYSPGPTAQIPFCYPTHHPQNTAMNLTRTSTNAVSGGGQHVGGPLAGAQGTAGVPQGTLQQPTQQPQTIPPMTISLTQSAYTAHNTGAPSSISNTYQKITTRPNAVMDIVDPTTGKNIAEDLYRNAASSPSEDSSRDTPQPQGSAIAADFASRVFKAANGGADTTETSSLGNNAQPTTNQHTTSTPSANNNNQSISNTTKMQSNSSSKDTGVNNSNNNNNQCNTNSSVPMQNTANFVQSSVETSPSSTALNTVTSTIDSSSKMTSSLSSSSVNKLESKQYLPQSNDNTWPKNDVQQLPAVDDAITSSTSISSSPSLNTENSHKDQHSVTVQESVAPLTSTPISCASTTDSDVKNALVTGFQAANTTTDNLQSANGTPVSFSNHERTQNVTKNVANSPPRRKSHTYHQQQQPQSQQPLNTNVVTAVNSSVADSSKQDLKKDKKLNDKTVSVDSKGVPTTLTNQNDQQSQQHQQQSLYHPKSNGDGMDEKTSTEFEVGSKNDIQQRSTDGKAVQKQKSQKKHKGRDLNRKGLEKEGTDMDAFVNPSSQPAKTDINKETLPLQTLTTNVEQQQQQSPQQQPMQQHQIVKEISIEEKDTNLETSESNVLTQREKLIKSISTDTSILSNSNELPTKDDDTTVPFENFVSDKTVVTPDVDDEKKISSSKDITAIIEDSNKTSNLLMDKKNNDVVDHAVVNDAHDVEAIVAQKNEENAKVSANLRRTGGSDSNFTDTPAMIDKQQNENESPNKIDTTTKATTPSSKYKYNDYQWSPTNTTGKKEYDREFLMKLQDDPQCRVRPLNLPDLEVVLKDCSRQTTRNVNVSRMFKDASHTRAHEQLFPDFSKSSFNAKLPPPTKKSYQGKSNKVIKPNVIHVTLSLRDDVKLRETENAWRPTILKHQATSEEEQKTQALFKKVRSILNKLTPQKFRTLVDQLKELDIDTQEKLEGVIKLVFEKAIDEPSFCEAYAIMCKELVPLKVLAADHKPGAPDNKKNFITFRKMLLIRCQTEFEKSAVDDDARISRVKEIDDCTDVEKKKELQSTLEEDDRLVRMKSVGNIRFIGELFKQDILTPNIMQQCIQHLLQYIDEENLECLCKLLTTIGKMYETKMSLARYINQLDELANSKNNKKISSRVRFMIQDVIDLRLNNWVPRRDENAPKTIDQIQKEAESERIDFQLNNTPINTPRKDDRNTDRRRNRGPSTDDGWSSIPLTKTRQPYTVETAKLNTKPPSMDEIKLGSRTTYVWNLPPNPGNKAPSALTVNKFAILDGMSDQEKRSPPLQLAGSRSTGPREYRSDAYKSSAWGDNRGSRNGNHPMSSSSSNSSRENSIIEGSRSQSISIPPPSNKYRSSTISCMPTANNTSSNTISNTTPKNEKELIEHLENLTKEILDTCKSTIDSKTFVKASMEKIDENFDNSSYPLFVRTSINYVLDRSEVVRRHFSILISHMIQNNYIPLSLFQTEYEKIIEFAQDLVIDIPMCWAYLAEILSEMLVSNSHPFVELKHTLATLKTMGTCGKLLGELFSKLSKDEGPKWVADKWDQSGLQWSDLLDSEREKVDDIISKYKLEFLINGCCNSDMPISDNTTPLVDRINGIHDHLLKLLRDSDFDNITYWIAANVGQQSKEELFIRTLITTILEISIEPSGESYKLNAELFQNFLSLITRYIDTEPQLELQCLIALEIYDYKLQHPQGVLSAIIDALYMNGTISDDAFLAWEHYMDPTVVHSHPIAVKNLTSFFVSLSEPNESSEET